MSSLQPLSSLSGKERLERLARIADELTQAQDAGESTETGSVSEAIDALVQAIESGMGSAKQRLAIGEALGRLGDPRIAFPDDPAYWVEVELDLGRVEVGRFLVTIQEWQRFVSEGAYENDSLWDEEGLAWLRGVRRRWPELASRDSVTHLVIPNQPVVGVTWHEARAYARHHDARLLSFQERLQVIRGEERRPYPWGEPFGSGNANTQEEVLGKPCAVGLFRGDITPEGVCDLAGNVAEWTSDRVGDEVVIHPGSWDRPSMAAWAKARELVPARVRDADLGFRLVRDIG